ncbi:azurin [Marivirga sp. S37H4]|uniref:Azurin n=1 Tax=Marivirga aurantiaca TaxID=2802615 RepID=A0A935C668_9BACT|nr:azurin [Marivirga aurantiaca]MBK6264204.1 azurin [Marivirga aurantiaca]
MKIFKITVSIVVLGLLMACGGNTSNEEHSEERKPTSQERIQQQAREKEENNVSENSEVKEVTIEGNDRMKFNKEEIRVKAGQTVRLTLKHVGEMPKEQMGHNWVLLTQGTDIMEFGQAAATAQDNDYIPEAESDKIIVHTELLGGGEEDTIEFTAPEKGTYDFICSFPGHVALMKGKFIVE